MDTKPTGDLEGKKIYIAEDDTFIGGMISRHIISKGLLATLFTTGESILEQMKTEVPDLVILDILLPGLNGIEILTAIRNDPRTANVPVLVVSNIDQPADREQIKKLNAQFFIKALVTPEMIVDNIRKTLLGK